MLVFNELVQPETVEEAYKILLKKRNNTIIGGGAFLRLGSPRIGTAIDLSKLNLDYITKREEYFEIGAMTSFRSLEISPLLRDAFSGVLPKAVSHIIGVQFRNMVTIGATVYSRYGFSDLLTALLALDTEVELVRAGRMTLSQYFDKPYERDVLTRIFIRDNARKAVYQSLRNSASDYPIVNASVSVLDNKWTICVGARPARANVAEKASALLSTEGREIDVEAAADLAATELSFGTNTRGTTLYRQAMCKVLVKRAITEALGCK